MNEYFVYAEGKIMQMSCIITATNGENCYYKAKKHFSEEAGNEFVIKLINKL